MGWACLDTAIGLSGDAAMLDRAVTSYSFSTNTSAALIIAKTVSPCLRFIRCTEPAVIIDVTVPAAVRITISDTTLSETIFSIVPVSGFGCSCSW